MSLQSIENIKPEITRCKQSSPYYITPLSCYVSLAEKTYCDQWVQPQVYSYEPLTYQSSHLIAGQQNNSVGEQRLNKNAQSLMVSGVFHCVQERKDPTLDVEAQKEFFKRTPESIDLRGFENAIDKLEEVRTRIRLYKSNREYQWPTLFQIFVGWLARQFRGKTT